MTLPHPNQDIALYYALRWIAKREGVGREIPPEEIRWGREVHLVPGLASSSPELAVYFDQVYAWRDGEYLVIVNEEHRNLVVLHSRTGTTKTYHWK